MTMAKTTRKKAAQPKTPRTQMSPEAKLAYTQVAGGLRSLGKSITEIQQRLRQAEQRIETDARSRIRALRREASTQLRALQARQREVARILRNLAAAAEGSWGEIKQAADVMLAEARNTAAAIIERVRLALRS
jgi:cell division septum initiation protein DivIVA